MQHGVTGTPLENLPALRAAGITEAHVGTNWQNKVWDTLVSLAGSDEKVNDLVHKFTEDSVFITFFYCVLDTRSGRVEYVNAGHNPPCVFRADGRKDYLDRGDRKIDLWYRQHPMVKVDFSDQPDTFLNINSPDDLSRIENHLLSAS